MPQKLMNRARGFRLGRPRSAALLAIVPLGLGAVLLAGLSNEETGTRSAAPEPTLGEATRLPSKAPASRRRGSKPVVVEALGPGGATQAAPRAEEEPPAHIRRENVQLRRELAHLKAIQAESRRVARQLQTAGINAGLLVGSGQLIWPVSGTLSSPFGQRWGRLHAGIDIAAPGGTPIRAADSGQVVLTGWQGGYGLYTCVQHTASLSTCYAHQSRIATSAGTAVRRGEVIGFVGNTGYSFGDHLHFETRVNGRPVDPLGFL